MLDYPALRAISAVSQTGSFEKAASVLNVTPSAVSQRVKQLEERLGTVLIVRGQPCVATEAGEWLCRHVESVGMLEQELMEHLPGLRGILGDQQPVTLTIATNADSLGTWFMPAIASFASRSGFLLNVALDDEEHTADWLKRGRVVAAVTSLEEPVTGCKRVALGAMRYRATASPAFIERYFQGGVTAEALRKAPAITFNQKDRLQHRWIRGRMGKELSVPTHWLPSTQGFLEASLAGMGWCLNPEYLAAEHLAAGRLAELVPDTPLDTPLYWQINRLAADRLAALTQDVVNAASGRLVRPQT